MIFTIDATLPRLCIHSSYEHLENDRREPPELIKNIFQKAVFNDKTKFKSSHCCSVIYLSQISRKQIQIGKAATKLLVCSDVIIVKFETLMNHLIDN